MRTLERFPLSSAVRSGLLVLAVSLTASCATAPKSARRNFDSYRSIVVVPVANRSNDLTAPILIRYFLSKELKSKGFVLAADREEVDQRLREMGISGGGSIDPASCQRIANAFGAGGALRATLVKFSQDLGEDRTVLQARFEWIDMQSGRILWEKEVELDKNGLVKVPVRMSASGEWTDQQIRSVAKSRAGALPKKAVSQAMGALHLKSILEGLR